MHWYFEKKVNIQNFDCRLIDTDIDECAEGIEECEEHCYNTVGSYVCNCTRPSYRLHSDGTSCESKSSHIQATQIYIHEVVGALFR